MITDQNYYKFKIVSKRTLNVRGSKIVDAAVTDKNETSYAYIIINTKEKIVGILFSVLQETKW